MLETQAEKLETSVRKNVELDESNGPEDGQTEIGEGGTGSPPELQTETPQSTEDQRPQPPEWTQTDPPGYVPEGAPVNQDGQRASEAAAVTIDFDKLRQQLDPETF